ncbi:hypothetical protein [Blastopirellula marina]|uniref:BRCT domain-containing protein n=1 Tax=Blastopirellula marina TaxID=124 RepID=A0A2S8FCW2_9BACT|nr:hypothetical protein [Blastopirellula marina]PQO29995.1 hypothetical protein C5Y98_22310 [Blastopirellula marina]PTL42464.1 hypothetical protein C5Y97_22320 [Blastopirellula marina]
MASRDNQGLQISLILLVMMVVGLGIVAGVFYNANAKAQADAKQANNSAQTAQSSQREAMTNLNRLKVMIGHTEETTMEEVETQFANDVATFVADENGTPADIQAMSYRKIPVELRNKYATLEQQLASAREQINTITSERDAARTERDTSVAQAIAAKNAADDKLTKLTAEYATERTSLQNQQKQVLAAKTSIEGQVAQVKAVAATEQTSLKKTITEQETLIVGLKKIAQDLKPKAGDRADGEIVWSNPRNKTVWVNLGSSDMLRPQMTFSVYPLGQESLVDSDPKGKIEITRIHSANQAEARLTEFNVGDPVMPGDTIFTPVWTPGRPEKFAIVGFVDLNGDDKDDTDELRNIIETAGSEVVAYVDAKGDIKGTLNPEIRYLILGDRPTDKTSEGGLAAYTTMSETARNNGVEAIRVDQFIRWAGYVGAEELVRLNSTSRLEEIEAAKEKEKAGFQKRRPNGNSAF